MPLAQLRRGGGTPAPPAPLGTPCPRLELSLPADGRCGRAGSQAGAEADGSLSPRGVSGTSRPSLRCWQGSAGGWSRRRQLGAAGTPQPWGLPGGALPLSPSPSCPSLSPARCGGLQRTRALQPLDGPRLPVGILPEWKNPSAFEILARFSEAESAGLALCSIGTSLFLLSCLHLETPLMNYVCVDLPPRGRQQARHWDCNPASACFG